MNKFQKWDKVVIYQGTARYVAQVSHCDRDMVYFNNMTHPFHYKQCRKLVKKKRREFWIDLRDPAKNERRGLNVFWAEDKPVNETGWIKVRECK